MAKLKSRLLRSYRFMTPGRFHAFNQKVRNALTDNAKIPESTWGANPALFPNYLAASQKHDEVYHDALLGGKLVISKRDILQAQVTVYLDEMALTLEAAELRSPGILLSSGFDLAKEQRRSPRAQAAATVPETTAEGQGLQG